MGEAVKKIQIVSSSSTDEDISKKIKNRQLSELIFGFCGAIGAGVSTIADKLEKNLIKYNYDVVKIKISDLLFENLDQYKEQINYTGSTTELRKNKNLRGKVLQDLGNYLRENKGDGTLSHMAIKNIAIKRKDVYEKNGKILLVENDEGKEEIQIDPDVRIAWFIDSFKNPEEVEVFRDIYRNIFYLVGVLCPRGLRAQRLEHKGISRQDTADIIERDKSEKSDHGQQLVKTIHLSDSLLSHSFK